MTVVLVALAGFCACGSMVGVTAHWRDPALAHAFHNVLVVGVSDRGLYRRLYEDEFAKRFAAHGITATASYLAVPGNEPTREQLAAAMSELHCDAVLVTHLVDIERRREYHEGPMTVESFVTSYGMGYYRYPYYAPVYGPGFANYYTVVYQYTHAPGYYETRKTYNLETTLHSAKDGKLVWALMSQAVDPKGPTEVITGIADVVFNSLKDDGLL
jgi:hypothetical protein